jgi:hypothetical protein
MKNCRALSALVLMLSLAYGQPVMGTTILVVLHGKKVWIAADSLLRSNTGDQRYACKINTQRDFYWAASSARYEDIQTGYSLPKMVAEVASTKGSLIDVMNALVAKAKIDSAKEFSLFKRDDPKDFASLVQPDNTVLVAKVVFVGKGNEHIPEVVVTVLVVEEIGGKMVVRGTPTPANGSGNFEFGASYVAQDYFLSHASSIKDDDPVPVMHDSVTAAANADPIHTGGKISILELSPNGSEWKEKGECE